MRKNMNGNLSLTNTYGQAVYMFVCSELIEETGRPPVLIFGMWRYFWPGSDKFEFWKKFQTFDQVMT